MSPFPLGVIGSAKAGTVILTPTFRGFNDNLTYTSGTPNTRSWAGAPIGDASESRTVIVMLTSWSGGQRNIGLNGMTIGGVAATVDCDPAQQTSTHFQMYRAVVPSGTTADIIVSVADNTTDTCFSVWTVDHNVAVESTDVVSQPVGSTTSTITLPSTVAGGFAISGFSSRSIAFTTVWSGTNVTERFDTGTAQPHSGADAAPTIGGPLAITADYSIATTNASHRIGAVAYKAA
jgi:hypothetical protein